MLATDIWHTKSFSWKIWNGIYENPALTANFKEFKVKEITFYCGCSWLFVQWVVTESSFHITHFLCNKLILLFHLWGSDISTVFLTYYKMYFINHQSYGGWNICLHNSTCSVLNSYKYVTWQPVDSMRNVFLVIFISWHNCVAHK